VNEEEFIKTNVLFLYFATTSHSFFYLFDFIFVITTFYRMFVIFILLLFYMDKF